MQHVHDRKAPPINALFWVVKIAATTLGEAGGDAVSMTLRLGYAVGSIVFGVALALLLAAQLRARRYHPALYWSVIIGTTTVGTTLADLMDRSVGLGYPGGVALLALALAAVLAAWRAREGRIASNDIATPRVERFYWAAILASNTLGTALGDWLADGTGLGYEGGALVMLAALAVVWGLHASGRLRGAVSSGPGLFWAAFVLTRPLGATLGDLLTKPVASGGLHFGRFTASAVLLGFIVLCLLVWGRGRPRAARPA